MSAFIARFAQHTWAMVAEMGPYLLFGFAVAGLLHILIRPERVRRALGKPGFGAVVKASLAGVPMPLCSCSVIPVAASLRKSGASRGATASFLSSTPQTGVDSILATYALLGGLFTLVRVVVAFVCGAVVGWLVDRFGKDPSAGAESDGGACGCGEAASAAPSPCCARKRSSRTFREALRHGFVTLPADLAVALIVGLVLAGLLAAALPPDIFSGALGEGPLAFLIATAISLPLYVCATASIPMAYALIAAGLSPGAALVFLIVGPATNTATVATCWSLLGRAATCLYVGTLVAISWLAGWLFNATLDPDIVGGPAHRHETLHPAAWQHASGIALVAVLLFALLRTKAAASACNEH